MPPTPDWRQRIEAAEARAAAALKARLRAGWQAARHAVLKALRPRGAPLTPLEVAHTGLALGLVLLVLGAVFRWGWAPGAAAAVLALYALWPRGAQLPTRLWRALAHLLGRVNALVLITLLYGLVLLPLAGLRALLRRRRTGAWADPRFGGPAPRTTFVARNHRYTADDLERPW